MEGGVYCVGYLLTHWSEKVAAKPPVTMRVVGMLMVVVAVVVVIVAAAAAAQQAKEEEVMAQLHELRFSQEQQAALLAVESITHTTSLGASSSSCMSGSSWRPAGCRCFVLGHSTPHTLSSLLL